MTTAFIAGVGPLELLIVLLIVLVIVGGRRLPALGRQLGEGVRGFKDAVTSRADSQWTDDDGGRGRATAALGRSTGDETPVEGDVMRERR
jgi:sec-independent protein translocase protein TatA